MSEPEQRKYNLICDTAFGKVTNVAGEASRVSMRVECGDKMGRSKSEELEALILPPHILMNPIKLTDWK